MRELLGKIDSARCLVVAAMTLLVVIFPGSTGRSTEAAFFRFRPVRTQPRQPRRRAAATEPSGLLSLESSKATRMKPGRASHLGWLSESDLIQAKIKKMLIARGRGTGKLALDFEVHQPDASD